MHTNVYTCTHTHERARTHTTRMHAIHVHTHTHGSTIYNKQKHSKTCVIWVHMHIKTIPSLERKANKLSKNSFLAGS